MALRSAPTPTVTAGAVSSAFNKPQSYPTSILAVRNLRWPFFAINPILKLNPKSRSDSSAAVAVRCSASALTPQLRSTLDKVIESNKVVVFMKGTKDFPMCGFSNTVVQILKNLNVPFEDVNILDNEILRQGLKEYSNWPTFPQLYIDGEFFGGCDITIESFQSGELKEVLEKAMCS